LKQYTTARILTEVGEKTPVFTRISTVAGGAGSVDTPRDVRGFAVKFYTKEGNWDLVGNNIPVFLPRLSNLWVNIVGLSAGSVLSKLKRPVFVATRFVGF